MSIATGVVGGNTINCDSAVEVGTIAMKKILGKTFGDIHLHRKDKVQWNSTVQCHKLRQSARRAHSCEHHAAVQ